MTTALVAVVGITVLSSFAQSVTGFGFALLGVPLLALVTDPVTAVVTVTLLSAVLTAGAAHTHRRVVQWRVTRTMVVTSLLGLPIGLALVRWVDMRWLNVLIGCVVVLFAVGARRLSLGGPRGTAVAGVASGALLASTGMSGPPIVLALHDRGLGPRSYRATLQAIFCVQDAFALFGFLAVGVLTTTAGLYAAVGAPSMLAGWWLGQRLVDRIDEGVFRRCVVGMLVASGTVSVATGVLG